MYTPQLPDGVHAIGDAVDEALDRIEARVSLAERQPAKERSVYVLTLRPDVQDHEPMLTMRKALKCLLRSFGLRCVRVEAVKPAPPGRQGEELNPASASPESGGRGLTAAEPASLACVGPGRALQQGKMSDGRGREWENRQERRAGEKGGGCGERSGAK